MQQFRDKLVVVSDSGDQEPEYFGYGVVQPPTWVIAVALGMVPSLETVFLKKKKLITQFCVISTKTFHGLRL